MKGKACQASHVTWNRHTEMPDNLKCKFQLNLGNQGNLGPGSVRLSPLATASIPKIPSASVCDFGVKIEDFLNQCSSKHTTLYKTLE